MTRQTLPREKEDTEGSLFFPTFQKELNRLIDQFRTGFPMTDDEERTVFGAPVFPAIDIVETDDAIEISAEVPGVQEEDLEATIAADVLTLKGKKSSEHEEKKDTYQLVERRYGSFKRSIPLGFTPEDNAVQSVFTDGVLTLTIAKPATAKTAVKKIDINKT